MLDLRAYHAKVVLLNFCAPCRLEMPHFVGWQTKYGLRGLQIIGISMDDDPALVRNLYQKLHLNYPRRHRRCEARNALWRCPRPTA
jgi:thiol-disulfide isomerase/thioredoxin